MVIKHRIRHIHSKRFKGWYVHVYFLPNLLWIVVCLNSYSTSICIIICIITYKEWTRLLFLQVSCYNNYINYIVACQRGGVSIKARQTSTGNDKTRCRNPLVLIVENNMASQSPPPNLPTNHLGMVCLRRPGYHMNVQLSVEQNHGV